MQKYYYDDLENLIEFVKPDIVLKNSIGSMHDIQSELTILKKESRPETRLLITYYNHLWEPLLKFASWLGWRKEMQEQNWLDDKDIENICELAGWEVITSQKRMLMPIKIPIISVLVNQWLAHIPIVNSFCLTTWLVAKPKVSKYKAYSVSIIVPARNEKGNIAKIVRSIPKFGTRQEIIFVEGGSTDGTWEAIRRCITSKVKAYQQTGVGKGDAVRLGFSKASGEILMILDADLTVDPSELPKFYEIIASGQGEFVNGSRLVYPMEKDAMRLLNKAGNKVFGLLFSWILGQRFKDTLCGTKVLLKSDYAKIAKNRKFFGDFDPFGDFDLIFGAVKQNLKVIEIPIRYKERIYGSTNINRFRHGWLLLKMTWFAFRKFRAW